MIKRNITETVYEYDKEGKLVKKTVVETTEEDNNYYYNKYPNTITNPCSPLTPYYDLTCDGTSTSTTTNITKCNDTCNTTCDGTCSCNH